MYWSIQRKVRATEGSTPSKILVKLHISVMALLSGNHYSQLSYSTIHNTDRLFEYSFYIIEK